MDSSNLTIAITLVVLIGLSAFFSGSETAFSTFNRVRMKSRANLGDKRADRALKLADNYTNLLSTILIGNNIVNILASSLATVLFTDLFGANGVTIATVVMTVLVLIFGEITPKSIAKERAEGMALSLGGPLKAVSVLLTPLNFLFSLWHKLLDRVVKPAEDTGITEEELLTIVDEAENEGGLDEHESDLIRSAIEFTDQDVEDILTPRVDVTAVDIDDDFETIEKKFYESGYSRLPVYREGIDSIAGILHEKDFFMHRNEKTIEEIMGPALFVMPSTKLSVLLRTLQKQKSHMAIVLDEFGGMAGVVTMEDVLEELVGEIWDEHDEVVEEFVEQADGSIRISGGAEIDEMIERFDLPDEYESSTVSGWVAEELGRIPGEGDEFTARGLNVRITQMEGRRILEILVRRAEEPEEADA